MKKINWVLDPGHGGVINGVYQTEGKRSPKWDDGTQLYEGENVRKIAKLIKEYNENLGTDLDITVLVPENEDIPLKRRVRRVNKIVDKKPNTILISLHHNAGGGTGFEVFTSRGITRSDDIATTFIQQLKFDFEDRFKFREDYSDGDGDKEAGFYILKHSRCPAILIEMLFMDTYEPDYKFISSDYGRNELAQSILMAMIKYEEEN